MIPATEAHTPISRQCTRDWAPVLLFRNLRESGRHCRLADRPSRGREPRWSEISRRARSVAHRRRRADMAFSQHTIPPTEFPDAPSKLRGLPTTFVHWTFVELTRISGIP